MANVVRAFGLDHPWWNRAVELRASCYTLFQILEAAREAGFSELTYSQLAYGLRNAPADLYLPTRTTIKLREKFGDVSARFNAYTAMLDLAQEAQIKMEEIDEELGNPETTPSRRQFLESQHYRWFGRAFDYSTVCTELAIQMRVAGVMLGNKILEESDEDDVEGEIVDHDQRLIEEFAARVPTFASEAVVADYGHDNVRPPEEDDGSDDDEESESDR